MISNSSRSLTLSLLSNRSVTFYVTSFLVLVSIKENL